MGRGEGIRLVRDWLSAGAAGQIIRGERQLYVHITTEGRSLPPVLCSHACDGIQSAMIWAACELTVHYEPGPLTLTATALDTILA